MKTPPFVLDEPGVYALGHDMLGMYIGCSKNVLTRFKRHKSKLIANKHSNEKLQDAWNTSGGAGFSFVVLEVTPFYYEAENFWVNEFDTFRNGLNRSAGGGGFKQHSTETRKKISIGKLGDKNPAKKSGAAISAALRGRSLSESHKLAISKAGKGKMSGDKNPAKRLEVRAKISAAMLGKTYGPRPAQSKALTGRVGVNNGVTAKRVSPEDAKELFALGWVAGNLK